MKTPFLPSLLDKTYVPIIKPLLFRFDPEFVHETITTSGELMGKSELIRSIIRKNFIVSDERLKQTYNRITFQNPVGLSAGFDYEAKLPQITPCLGFGFQTVGTISYDAYKGNEKPRLGRLPKSQSLLVNKGFKNLGVIATAKKMQGKTFAIPIGISIGRTNNPTLDQKQSIKDIMKAFAEFQEFGIQNAYFELNISCPNLSGTVDFYTKKHLKELLDEIDKLQLKKPLYIKMPISLSNQEILNMLDVIAKHNIQGVIIGNLQKNRSEPSLIPEEVKKFPVGNFSGKPTFSRSNELIALTYKYYKHTLLIIGCGGIFSAEDAYTKIQLGASLVQLITGLIFNGPQLIYKINNDLLQIMERDGIKHISQAIGSKNKQYV